MSITKQNQIDLALGKFDFSKTPWTSEEWVRLIRGMIDIVRPEYLRGCLSPLSEHVQQRGKKLKVAPEVLEDALTALNLPSNMLFADMSEVISFPSETPRKQVKGKYGGVWNMPVSFAESKLLLSRKKQIFLFAVRWNPIVESESGESFSYEYETKKAGLTVVNDKILTHLLRHYRNRGSNDLMHLGQSILLALYMAQAKTSDAYELEQRYARERVLKVAKMLQMLGMGHALRSEDDI